MIISNNPTFAEVACLLGDQYVNAERDKALNCNLSGLCTSSKINIWSKYKPVIYPCNDSNKPDNWWKSSNGNCGIKYEVYPTLNELIAAITNNPNEIFSYEKPHGGSKSPYRISDFAGYNSKARIPIVIGNYNGEEYPKAQVRTIQFSLIQMSGGDPNALTAQDVFSGFGLQDIYFGVALHKEGSVERWKWMTTAVPFSGSEIASVPFPTGILETNAIYEVIQFLTYDKSTSVNTTSDCFDCMAIPTISDISYIQKIKITGSALTVTIRAVLVPVEDGGMSFGEESLEVTITVYNTTGATEHFKNCSLYGRYGPNAQDKPMERGEWYQTIPDFDAPSGNATVKKYTFTVYENSFLPPREPGVDNKPVINSKWIYFFANNKLQDSASIMGFDPGRE